MALGDPYATAAELKSRLDITTTTYDTEASNAVDTASRQVEQICSRQFNLATSATARVYEPGNCEWLDVDDIASTSGLVIATGTDGTYTTTWSSTDYLLYPLNGAKNAATGWPYEKIRAVAGHRFPVAWCRPTVQITATWGWATVPTSVKEATLILAAELLKLREAPFGVAGVDSFGVVRVRNNPKALTLLAPYTKGGGVMVG